MTWAKNDKGTVLFIDCQLLQCDDRYRGMGLYLASLLKAISKNDKDNIKWRFITNSKLSKLSSEDKSILDTFGGEIIETNLYIAKDGLSYLAAADKNRLLIGDIVDPGAEKIVFFIPALFSSQIYPVFPRGNVGKVLLFHDIIPFLYHEQYFNDHEGEQRRIDYSERWGEAYKTDLFVTNSQTTADDLTIYFGVDPSRCVPIFGAGAERTNIKPSKPKLDLKDFVLMPSGDDFRKNNEAAVAAFAALGTDIQLVITSSFGVSTQNKLKSIYPNTVFSGNVNDAELLWLIDNTKLVYFPSLYEGLGMPVLEAVDRQAVIACANIPVFNEISNDAFFYFNPNSPASMTATLNEALKENIRSKEFLAKKNLYKNISKKYSWSKTAEAFIEMVNFVTPARKKQKLAVFCPSPSSYSSVGKYAFECHAELSRLFDIDYYFENGQTEFKPTRPNILEYAANYYPASTFAVRNTYDAVLYHIGNSEFHTQTILNALRYPANAIVHDTWLNGIFDYMEHHGYLTEERRKFEALLDQRIGESKSSCLSSIATNQLRIFCHSDYAKDAISSIDKISTKTKIIQTIHPIGVPVVQTIKSDLTISFAGIISEDKGISLISTISKLSGLKVRVFGFGVLGETPLLKGLGPNVEVVHDLTDKDFQDALRTTDILVNYRINYHGETSRSALEAMRYGGVVAVRDVGWFSELPDDCVVKVKSESELMDSISQLVNDPSLRQQIGKNARNYLSSGYSYSRYAKLFAKELRGKS